MTQPIIPEIPARLIEAELTPERFLRNTNKGGNQLYVLMPHHARRPCARWADFVK